MRAIAAHTANPGAVLVQIPAQKIRATHNRRATYHPTNFRNPKPPSEGCVCFTIRADFKERGG